MDRCDSCSFVYADIDAPAIPTRLAAVGTQHTALLLPPGRSAAWFGILRNRPEEGVWSALEYACHVRDVFLVQRDRLYTALVEDKARQNILYTSAEINRPDSARYSSTPCARVQTAIIARLEKVIEPDA